MDDRGRTYGGLSDDERRADRRNRLLDAALALLGSVGWEATSIERVCAEACVATRSFYEEFSGRDELLEAVYTQVFSRAVEGVFAELASPGAPQERVHRAIRHYVLHVTADHASAQLLHLDARRMPSLTAMRHEFLAAFFAALPASGAHVDEDRPSLRARAVAGAINEVIAHWLSSPHPRPDRELLAEQVGRTLTPAALAGSG